MKKVKFTFNIPEDVLEMLKARVPARQRSDFITGAINARFNSMQHEQFLRQVAEANMAINRDLEEIEASLEPDDAILQSDDDLMDDDEILELDNLI